MPTYRKNYLSDVLLRYDYTSPIDTFQSSFPTTLDESFIRSYSTKESKNVLEQQINIDDATDKVIRNKSVMKEWNYYSNDKAKRICLTKNFVFFHHTQYISHEDFLSPVRSFNEFASANLASHTIKRIGLRYINQIPLSSNMSEWSQSITDTFLSPFRFVRTEDQISRCLSILELNIGTNKLKIQAGMPNPDYPATIRKMVFTLDFDAYREGQTSFNDAMSIIDELRSSIDSYFELSITDQLRAKLNE